MEWNRRLIRVRAPGTSLGVGLALLLPLLTGACNDAIGSSPVTEPFEEVAAGGYHACGLTTAGRVYCWGRGKQGQLGNGGGAEQQSPVPVKDAPRFIQVAAGYYHTCAVADDRSVRCWGANDREIGVGQLGNGSVGGSNVPVEVRGNVRFTHVSAGFAHTCALAADDAAYCWGRNADGQLGDGTRTDRVVPTPVAGGLRFRSLSAGEQYTCGVATSGAAYCWGSNLAGVLGSEPSTRCFLSAPCSVVPARVDGARTFSAIASGADHTCGVAAAGESYCWGLNRSGALGVGDTVAQRVPARTVVGKQQFAVLSAGIGHTCGLAATGKAYCWGNKDAGQLGTEAPAAGCIEGREHCSAVPLPVAGGQSWKQINAGVGFTCGVSTDGIVYCWGINEESQLGVAPATVELCRGGGLRCSMLPVRVSGQQR